MELSAPLGDKEMNFTKKVIGVLSYTTLLIGLMVFMQKTHLKEYHQESIVDLKTELIELKKEIELNSQKCEILRNGVNFLAEQLFETQNEINKLHKLTDGEPQSPALRTISH